MSDPMSMPEIEDVVSSIKRLVSETGPSREAAAEPQAEVGKFVLTPALRVEDPEPEADADETAEGHANAADLAEDVAEDDDLGQEASLDLAEDALTEETAEEAEAWSAPEDEDAEWSMPEVESADDAQDEAESLANADETLEWQDDNEDDAEYIEPAAQPENFVYRAESLEDRIAELEAAVGAHADEFEPDGSEDEPPAPQSATILSLARSAGARNIETVDDAPLSNEYPEEDFDEPRDEFAALADEDPLEMSGEETLLDEEALRDMVAQIVREELQGELGERITRNVRRLVRREVQRAMTLREFD